MQSICAIAGLAGNAWKDSSAWSGLPQEAAGSVSSGAGGVVALWEIRNAAMAVWEIPAQPSASFPA